MGSFNVALLEALLSAGVSHDRARAVVDLFDKSVDERYSLHAQILATKGDVAEIQAKMAETRGQLEARIAEARGQLEARIAETRGQFESRVAQVEARIDSNKAELVKWMLAAITAQTTLLLGAIRLF
jgi:regulator of protease activity HflC (stomatin/prohibitin superfamily)